MNPNISTRLRTLALSKSNFFFLLFLSSQDLSLLDFICFSTFCQKPHLDISFDFVDFLIFLEFSLFLESASWAIFKSQVVVSPCSRMTHLISLYSNSWRLQHVMLVKLQILWLVRFFGSLISLMSWAVRIHLSSFERVLEDFGILCLWSH